MKLTDIEQPNEFNAKRVDMYLNAMKMGNDVRMNELGLFSTKNILDINPKIITEIGSGNGYLTNHLSKLFPSSTIYAIDASDKMKENILQSPNIQVLKNKAEQTGIENNSVDLITSLATFHHIINKKQVLKEVNRILKPGGTLVISDVADGTAVQEFFDTIVKENCITGHDFDFLDSEWISNLAEKNGFEVVSSEVKDTPWIFDSEDQMIGFIKNLTGLEISNDQLKDSIYKIFRVEEKDDKTILHWQLGLHILKKKVMTERKQSNHLMSLEEIDAYTEIIRNTPHLYKPILSEINEFAKDAETLTDIGCGDGYLLEQINNLNSNLKLKGVDVDNNMIEKAKSQLPFDFEIGKAESFEDSADVVTSNLSLHHFKNPLKALKNLYKSAKKFLIISDQLRPSTICDLEARLAKRFEILSSRDVPYYAENEKESILEAYSKEEIISLLDQLGCKYKIKFFDEDYYERFVASITK